MTALAHNITWGTCTACHYSFEAFNKTIRPDRYVNSTMFSASPHGSLECQNCHTRGHKNVGARKACEDCHAIQQNQSERDRHDITSDPYNYKVNGTSVVNITDCTICHDPTLYSNSVNTYGYNKTYDCNYCHTYPDKTYP
ncbi:Cytochrome c7 c [uncultured archaeon]|nr:Cytochrome c7 c [uncultured archaeon]